MGSSLNYFMGVLVVCKNELIEEEEYDHSECQLCYRKYFSEEHKYCSRDAAIIKPIYKKSKKAKASWVDITDKIDEVFFHIPSTDLTFDIYNSNRTEFVFGKDLDKEGLLGIPNKEEQEKIIKEFEEHFTKEIDYLKSQYPKVVRIIYDLVTYWY